jgi:hypothetical protein
MPSAIEMTEEITWTPIPLSITSMFLISFISYIFIFSLFIVLYTISLVGIIKRRPFAVPFTRGMLIVTMLGFPIGTIIGVVLWRRINNPVAKKYLNYGI